MEITYKVVLKGSSGNWNTPFSSLEDVYSHFDKERIKEINIYYKGKYMGKQSDVEKFREGIKKISKEMNKTKKMILDYVEILKQHKYLIYIQFQLEKNKIQYNQLKSDNKVKGVGIKIPIGVKNLQTFNPNLSLDDDGMYIDYLIKVLNQYGYGVEEKPPIMFVPYSGRCIITKGINMDDYYWVGMDCNIKPNKYGFDIHNHLNPHTHSNNDINLSFELIEDLNKGVRGGNLFVNNKRFNLGTTIILMSVLKDTLTQEEMEKLMLSDNSHSYKGTDLNKSIWYERLNVKEIKMLSDNFKGERIKYTTIQSIMENPNHKWIDCGMEFDVIEHFKILHNPLFTKGELIGEHYFTMKDGGKIEFNHYREWDF